ncbi:MAG: hypothetical protein IIY38_07645 [Clostridia bacterium]|nr:hypothetical protein [Clostridia bacterium]
MYKKIIGDRYLMERQNNYPFIVVHGFLGYGEGSALNSVLPYFGFRPDRKVVKQARSMGFEVYAPSLGGFNSMWDRACDLYAQIIGGTTDYGKVHSEKFGHLRYGHTYDKPLVPDWGKLDAEGKIKKINLIGHSFGSPTVRTLIELLVNGSEEERAGTPEEELSDLFKGGKKNWVHTCTTLAACNGVSLGVAFTESPRLYNGVINTLAYIFLALGNTPFVRIYDIKMPQWGLTEPEYTGWLKGMHIKINKEKIARIEHFVNAKEDNIAYELSWDTCAEMTKDYSPKENIYYFTFSGDTTEPIPGSKERRAIPGTFPPMAIFANVEGKYLKPERGIEGEKWFHSDGLVNTWVAPHPPGEPYKDYDGEENIEPGIWIQFPIEQKHHMSYMGVNETPYAYFTFFHEIMKRACSLPTIDIED